MIKVRSMKKSALKKIKRNGTLVSIKGTDCVFMSLGVFGGRLESFNGFNLKTAEPVTRCDGEARLATEAERARYWACVKRYIYKED